MSSWSVRNPEAFTNGGYERWQNSVVARADARRKGESTCRCGKAPAKPVTGLCSRCERPLREDG